MYGEIQNGKKDLGKARLFIRTLLLLKFTFVEIVEWIGVILLKRFTASIYQSVNLLFFGVIVLVNVAVLIDILQRLSWYKYACNSEKKKDKVFADPVMEKIYNALVLDYKWLFYRIFFIYFLNTLFLLFFIL